MRPVYFSDVGPAVGNRPFSAGDPPTPSVNFLDRVSVFIKKTSRSVLSNAMNVVVALQAHKLKVIMIQAHFRIAYIQFIQLDFVVHDVAKLFVALFTHASIDPHSLCNE